MGRRRRRQGQKAGRSPWHYAIGPAVGIAAWALKTATGIEIPPGVVEQLTAVVTVGFVAHMMAGARNRMVDTDGDGIPDTPAGDIEPRSDTARGMVDEFYTDEGDQ